MEMEVDQLAEATTEVEVEEKDPSIVKAKTTTSRSRSRSRLPAYCSPRWVARFPQHSSLCNLLCSGSHSTGSSPSIGQEHLHLRECSLASKHKLGPRNL
ncbi:uncharacterized protein LOC144549646 isoform X5 [Carex rostrata]